MRFRQTSFAWAGSAVWAACHRHRKADTSELLKPVPISPRSRNLEHYDYFQREKYRGDQGPSAFQCRPVRVSFFAEGAKTVAHNHGGIDKVRLLEGKQGVLVRMKPSEHHVLFVK